ncbi:MAG: hypothetical protein JWM97_535 [Phycisphaerales bacterium]|nr:hypothetical protein [Phycisphaerales bacterium]
MQWQSGEPRLIPVHLGFKAFASIASVCAALFIAGCAPTPKPQPKAAPVIDEPSRESVADPLEFKDPCAARLHDISGAMLLCYAVNHQLPAQLQDLSKYAELDQTLEFTCPESHQPYVYVREGLPAPSGGRRLVLYDATPVHKGTRWAILMRPSGPGQSAAAWVVQLSEPMLQTYLPANVPPLK